MNFNWFEKTKIMIFGQNQQNSIYFEISLQEYFQKTTKQSRKACQKQSVWTASFLAVTQSMYTILVFHHKAQSFLADLDDINAVFIAGSIDADFGVVGLKLVHFLAKGVIDAHHAEAFALQGHEVIGGIRENANK